MAFGHFGHLTPLGIAAIPSAWLTCPTVLTYCRQTTALHRFQSTVKPVVSVLSSFRNQEKVMTESTVTLFRLLGERNTLDRALIDDN